MKKWMIITIVGYLGVMSNLFEAKGETLTISSSFADGAWTSLLQSGQLYTFQASGTWICSIGWYNDYGMGLSDAEWGQNPSGPPYDPQAPWTEEFGGYSYDVHDLLINDVSVDWLGSTDGVNWAPHVFSPDHVYRYDYIGTGESVHLYICDHSPYGPPQYGDNSGSLSVEVTPEPATLLLLGLGSLALLRKRRA